MKELKYILIGLALTTGMAGVGVLVALGAKYYTEAFIVGSFLTMSYFGYRIVKDHYETNS